MVERFFSEIRRKSASAAAELPRTATGKAQRHKLRQSLSSPDRR